MSPVTFYRVIVTRDANTKIPKDVSPWELQVMSEALGEVEIVEEFVREFAVPEAGPERARLERVYGNEPETKVPYVEIAYGRGPLCDRALAKAIAQSVVSEPKRGPGRPPSKDAAAAA